MNTFGIPLTWWFALAGLVIGNLLSWVLCSRRAAQREEALINAAREQIAQSTQNLRLVNTKLQNDLDKVRAMAAQGQTAALVLHLQSQLRAANMEMDRLQHASTVVATAAKPETADTDGFAVTRPFER